MITTSAFAGIGGLELGISAAIPETDVRYQIEIDRYCNAVLEKHWPETTRYRDIKTVRPEDIEGTECLLAGFPCTDISKASPTGTGLAGERSGLFWEVKRLVRSVPTIEWVVLENVPGLLSGRGMGSILASFHECGFSYVEWDTLSSAAIGSCHRRDRIFIICCRDAPNTVLQGLQEWEGVDRSWAYTAVAGSAGWDSEPPVCPLDDGFSPRVVNRRAAIKALGNSVQPQVAYFVGLRLKALMNKEASNE